MFFAAERTLLAWVRTGITIIALGFVVARFGLFVRLLALESHGEIVSAGPHSFSVALGVALVIAGAISVLVATFQHRRFVATLTSPDLPPAYSGGLSVALAVFIAVVGLLLAAYLLIG